VVPSALNGSQTLDEAVKQFCHEAGWKVVASRGLHDDGDGKLASAVCVRGAFVRRIGLEDLKDPLGYGEAAVLEREAKLGKPDGNGAFGQGLGDF